jgi:hypothetical protein
LKTDSFSIDKGNLAELVEEVFKADDWEVSFYRVWGLVDPYDGDLGEIRKFIISNPGPFTIEYLTGELAEKEPMPIKRFAYGHHQQ